VALLAYLSLYWFATDRGSADQVLAQPAVSSDQVQARTAVS
jgi:hypothetical protein